MSESRIRQNFAAECEAMLNKQISLELHASYIYQSMATYFHRDDIALKGFQEYFHKRSEDKKEHSERIMKYITKRGGFVHLQDIQKPSEDNWGTGLQAFEAALQLEKSVNQSLLDIHKVASKFSDPHLTHYLEDECCEKQVELLYQMSCHITNLKRVGPGLGEYMFNKESLD
ncbi:hypothetical protein HELRODRAFT_178793 [Helobdella robusta]|uniref:Ferritin n=1 Tax=Helobdella robusta TaxID=6412 RepID=T1FDR1_HELRO|nr:hypothetical protein HELRODRAFT_178793 [Helobdella robusta]ESN95877.1 hypothetical protein HELRODRAFT_178793 [Helobdella robusta]